MKKNLLVAVTGGIGSGKSYLIEILKKKGFSTLSCDGVARDILELRSVKKQLKKLFPSAVNGKIFLSVDRKKLSDIVFNDKLELKKLNDLTHPIIIKKTLDVAKKLPSPVFIEVPLLFESKSQDLFDKVIVVTRDKNQRIESVINRSALSKEEVLSRMNNQVDYDTLDLSKYIIVKNDKDLNLIDSIYTIIQQIYS